MPQKAHIVLLDPRVFCVIYSFLHLLVLQTICIIILDFWNNLQNMVDFMEESTKEIMKKWERIIEESDGGGKMAEIVIDNYMKELTGDIISKFCFGGSYALGNQIFSKIAALQRALAKPNVLIGFLHPRFLHSLCTFIFFFLYFITSICACSVCNNPAICIQNSSHQGKQRGMEVGERDKRANFESDSSSQVTKPKVHR